MASIVSHPLREEAARAQIHRYKQELDEQLHKAIKSLTKVGAMMRDVIIATGRSNLRPALEEIAAALDDIRFITTSALPTLDFVKRIENRLISVDRLIAAGQPLAHERRAPSGQACERRPG